MFTVEILNLLVSTGGAALLTMMSQKAADLAEERKFRHLSATEIAAIAKDAREFQPQWKGYYWIRGALALSCAFYIFILPSLLCMFANVQVVVGYLDGIASLIPFMGGTDNIIWIKLGSAAVDAHVYVIDPLRSNISLSVFGMFFGNQVARRG